MAYTTHGGGIRHPTTSDTNHPSTALVKHPALAMNNHPSSGATSIWTITTSVTCLRAWQSDFGITMGGTPLPSGTSTPNVTLTGSASGNPAFRLEVQTTGTDGVATYRYGAENTGSTSSWIEQNKVVPAGGGTVAAIGAMSGVSIVFPAGTYTNDNIYQGTASAWVDQQNSASASQGTSAKQPRILSQGIGSGRILLRGDGVDDSMFEPTIDLPSPATTPTFVYGFIRQNSWTVNKVLFDCGPSLEGITVFTTTASPNVSQYCGAVGNETPGATVGSLVRLWTWFNNGADGIKAGSATEVTGTNSSFTDPGPGIRMFAANTDVLFSNIDIVALFYFNGRPTAGELSAMDAAGAAQYSGLVI